MNINDIVTKTIRLGTPTGEREVVETYRVTEIAEVGKNKVRWAVGVCIASDDDSLGRVGSSNWIGVA